jgi:CRISPR-associated exonuclease Cas4
MDSYIPISTINDFLYCPKSLYLHSIYNSFETSVYHSKPQVVGGIAHENIENGTYTTAAHILQGLSVSSERIGVRGKIDIYDTKKHQLIERKYRVKQIYLGFKYQLYAQMYCLEEAAYPVKELYIQSLSDNKRYEISIPNAQERQAFEETIDKMKNFTPEDLQNHTCSHCQNHIYDLLSW